MKETKRSIIYMKERWGNYVKMLIRSGLALGINEIPKNSN